MNKKYNKGFTLLELLVAIAIFTTIIFIGYKIIDKSTIAVKDQGNINKGQLAMNNMNEYLTKDLEQSTSVELYLDNDNSPIATTKSSYKENEDSEGGRTTLESATKEYIYPKLDEDRTKFVYKYIIRNNAEDNIDDIIYTVSVDKNHDNIKYTVDRLDENGIKLKFNGNEMIKDKKLPFMIINSNSYKVIIGYEGKKGVFNEHEFEVASRLSAEASAEPEPPDPVDPGTPEEPLPPPEEPEIDDLIDGNNGYISFEYGNFQKDENYGYNVDGDTSYGNLRVSVGGVNDNGKINRLAYQLGSSNDSYIPICGIIDPNDNNGKVWAKVDKFGDNSGTGNGFYSSKEYFGKNNNINAINITVTEGSRLLNLKINGETYKMDGKEYSNFETGKYILTNQTSFNEQIKVTGTLQKTGSKGAIVITFGTSK